MPITVEPALQRRGVLVLLLALGAGALAPLAGRSARGAVAAEPASPAEHRFVVEATTLALGTLEAARLAEQRALDAAVRVFAAKVAEEEARLLEDLRDYAQRRAIGLPDAPGPERRRTRAALAQLAGEAFDRRFVQQIGREDQQSMIEWWEFGAAQATDPDLHAWIERTLPRLRERLAAALQLPTLVIA
jgi:putative membrane protein